MKQYIVSLFTWILEGKGNYRDSRKQRLIFIWVELGMGASGAGVEGLVSLFTWNKFAQDLKEMFSYNRYTRFLIKACHLDF